MAGNFPSAQPGPGAGLKAASAGLRVVDPIYIDVVIRRWQGFTGKGARHAPTVNTFTEIAVHGGEHDD